MSETPQNWRQITITTQGMVLASYYSADDATRITIKGK